MYWLKFKQWVARFLRRRANTLDPHDAAFPEIRRIVAEVDQFITSGERKHQIAYTAAKAAFPRVPRRVLGRMIEDAVQER